MVGCGGAGGESGVGLLAWLLLYLAARQRM